MTQQPYYPPQYPQAPQQPYPAQPPAQQYPPQPAPAYPQPPQQGYPAPAYGGAPAPQQQAPQVPLAQGSLDAFYSQPSAASGPSISWTDKQGNPKPIGTTYAGIVARDVTHADVQQQTDFQTGAPLFYRDGRPKFAMKVPLKVQPSQEFPEGEASWYVKGQARDELVRAMSEAGVEGSPKAGDAISITLVQRRPSGRGMNPANVVQVSYQPAAGRGQAQGQQQGTEAPSPAAVPQQTAQTPQAPVQELPQQAYAPNAQPIPPAQPQQPAQGYAPTPEVQAGQQAQQTAQQGMAVPEGLSPDQAALFARLTGNQG